MIVIFWTMVLPAKNSRGDIYSSTFEFDYELNIDRTDEGSETDQIFTETFDTKYSQKLSPQLDIDVSFKIELENEFQSDGEDTTRLLPEIEIDGKANYWDISVGAKRERESTDEPFEPTRITDNYFIEYFFKPATKNVPDLKIKYTIDTDEQGSDTNTEDRSFEASSVYELGNIVKLKVDYTRDESDDNINSDSDTTDETFSTEETMKYIFSEKIKFDFKHQYESDTGATLLDTGGKTNETDEEANNYQAKVTYNLFNETKIEANYEYDREEEKVENTISDSEDFEVKFSQKIGEPIDFDFSYSKTIDEERGIDQNTEDTEDTYTYDLDLRFSDALDFSLKYEETETDTDDRLDPANDLISDTRDFSFSWDIDTPSFIKITFTYDWSDEEENGVKKSRDRDYSIKAPMEFEAINLNLEPTYDLSITEDFTKTTDQETRTIDFTFDISYDADISDNLRTSFSHQYGRTVEQPGKIINRDDSTNLDIDLDEPWEGSTFSLSLSRDATDTSGDDSPPDITSTISVTWDHTMDPFDFSMSYQYDKNKLADDSTTVDFSAGLAGLNFDTELKFSFDKTFSDELDESYTVTFNFTYEF